MCCSRVVRQLVSQLAILTLPFVAAAKSTAMHDSTPSHGAVRGGVASSAPRDGWICDGWTGLIRRCGATPPLGGLALRIVSPRAAPTSSGGNVLAQPPRFRQAQSIQELGSKTKRWFAKGERASEFGPGNFESLEGDVVDEVAGSLPGIIPTEAAQAALQHWQHWPLCRTGVTARSAAPPALPHWPTCRTGGDRPHLQHRPPSRTGRSAVPAALPHRTHGPHRPRMPVPHRPHRPSAAWLHRPRWRNGRTGRPRCVSTVAQSHRLRRPCSRHSLQPRKSGDCRRSPGGTHGTHGTRLAALTALACRPDSLEAPRQQHGVPLQERGAAVEEAPDPEHVPAAAPAHPGR
jgi:hypothetical protein